MPLHSTIDPTSPEFARNAEVMRGLVTDLREKLKVVAGGGMTVCAVGAQGWLLRGADGGCVATPGVEAASGRWRDRAMGTSVPACT